MVLFWNSWSKQLKKYWGIKKNLNGWIFMMFFVLVGGLVTLIVGADLMVRGAVKLAAAVGVSGLTIGLTVVAFGTSAPELAVSARAALSGQAGIAVGNVVGSNVFNVLFILGLSAIIAPLTVSRQLIRMDVPIMIGLSVLVFGMALDGYISQIEGVGLLIGLLLYTLWTVWQGRQSQEQNSLAVPASKTSFWHILICVGLVGIGLGSLVVGARWLVDGAVEVARSLGVREQMIGLTIVAAGTSMPEVVTSVMASMKGERDIAVGNVVGSNIFNLLGVLGVAGALAPIEISAQTLWADLPIMLAVAVACLPVFFTGQMIARWEGALFLGYYIFYMAFLILTATGASLKVFQVAMLAVVVPLTVLTLGISLFRQTSHKARSS